MDNIQNFKKLLSNGLYRDNLVDLETLMLKKFDFIQCLTIGSGIFLFT